MKTNKADYIPDNGAPALLSGQLVWTSQVGSRARRWLSRNGFHASDVRAMDHTAVHAAILKHYPSKGRDGAFSYLADGCPLGALPDSAENGPQLCDCGAVACWHGDQRGLREFCCEACWAVSAGNPERVAAPAASSPVPAVEGQESRKGSPGAVSVQSGAYLAFAPVLLVVQHKDGSHISAEVLSVEREVVRIRETVAGTGYVLHEVPLGLALDAKRFKRALGMVRVECDHVLTWHEISQETRNVLTRVCNITEGAPEA